ncbi:MAG: hypothetical protein ACRCXZ_01530 [Patescibacteria group bacterium]
MSQINQDKLDQLHKLNLRIQSKQKWFNIKKHLAQATAVSLFALPLISTIIIPVVFIGAKIAFKPIVTDTISWDQVDSYCEYKENNPSRYERKRCEISDNKVRNTNLKFYSGLLLPLMVYYVLIVFVLGIMTTYKDNKGKNSYLSFIEGMFEDNTTRLISLINEYSFELSEINLEELDLESQNMLFALLPKVCPTLSTSHPEYVKFTFAVEKLNKEKNLILERIVDKEELILEESK